MFKMILMPMLAVLVSFEISASAASKECAMAPEMKETLKAINSKENPLDHMTPQSVIAFRKSRDEDAKNTLSEIKVKKVQDFSFDDEKNHVGIRVYTPEDPKLARAGKWPLIVFIHGGGWTLGSIATYDSIARKLAQATPSVVASLEYSLAPEHPYPAAINNVMASLKWLTAHAVELNLDLQRVAVVGDSGGGNLATVAALKSRQQKDYKIVSEVLFYPSTNLAGLNTASFQEFATGFLLTKKSVESFRQFYVPAGEDLKKESLSPGLAADLKGMPSTLIITAGCDLLRDEGKAYAEKLKSNGVNVVYQNEARMVHGYLNFYNRSKVLSPISESTLLTAADELGRAFSVK